MHSTVKDWRKNNINMYDPIQRFDYHTDVSKKEMKQSFGEDLLNLHLLPDPYTKNLADTIITPDENKSNHQGKCDKNRLNMPAMESEAPRMETTKTNRTNTPSPAFAGVANFISGVVNVIQGAMFQSRPKSPAQPYDCFDDSNDNHQRPPPIWQQSNNEVQNKSVPFEEFSDALNTQSNMNKDCKAAVEKCEDKLNRVRLLLETKPVPTPKYRSRRPRKVFVEPGSVEESFEDAFTPEDFVSLSNDSHIEHYSAFQNQDQELLETDAPKMKTSVAPVQESTEIIKALPNLLKKCDINNKLTNDKESINNKQNIVNIEDCAPKTILIKESPENGSVKDIDMSKKHESVHKQEIVPTKPDIVVTKQEVVPTKQEVFATRQEVALTKQEVAATKQEVSPNTQEVVPTNQEVVPLKQELDPTNQEVNTKQQVVPTKQEIVPTKDEIVSTKKEIVTSCEDKVSKLKALLQERRKNNTKVTTSPDFASESVRKSDENPKSMHVSMHHTKNKRYKNPCRTTDKRKKSKLRQNIQEDMLFANELHSDEVSSVENSPSKRSVRSRLAIPICSNRLSDSNVASSLSDSEYFDEISGRFHSTSTTDSDDSFQIVFNDSPKSNARARLPSDCDSEDSFIVFEDSPENCYTTEDVFGDDTESDTDASDSDSEPDDSDCSETKLCHNMSKTFGDLTDDSLYEEEEVDEVDCAVRTLGEEIRSDKVSDKVCDKDSEAEKSTGLLLTNAKKLLKKNTPQKRVQFSSNPPKVHVMRVWAFAARQARVGDWSRYSIDRERFKRRIADVDMAVSWVLKPQHRARIMFQRFMPWWNKQKRIEEAEKKAKAEEERLKREEEERLKKEEEERIKKEEEERLKKEEEERLKMEEEERLKKEELKEAAKKKGIANFNALTAKHGFIVKRKSVNHREHKQDAKLNKKKCVMKGNGIVSNTKIIPCNNLGEIEVSDVST